MWLLDGSYRSRESSFADCDWFRERDLDQAPSALVQAG
jgi:hypothetical protein